MEDGNDYGAGGVLGGPMRMGSQAEVKHCSSLNHINKLKARQSYDMGGPVRYARPLMDENAPDLYIPVMSFISFVLAIGVANGQRGIFTPEILTTTTSFCFVSHILQILLIRLAFYLVSCPCAILDITAFTGYKYVG